MLIQYDVKQMTLAVGLLYIVSYITLQILKQCTCILYYHILCSNMFVFACPIIAKSQCWLFAHRANIHICPQISVFALIYPYLPPNSTSGICAVVSKKISIKSYFNQINTFQYIGIKFK